MEDGSEPRYEPDKILEVGNVLSHYFKVTHEVVDKYEMGTDIINKDITRFASKKRYKLIVSISTLEHVGFDEKPKKPEKCLLVFKNVKKLLDRGGKFVFTIPVGYNLYLDEGIRDERIRIDELYGMRRISKENRWVEEYWRDTIEKSKYGVPYPFGNGIIIGIIKKGS